MKSPYRMFIVFSAILLAAGMACSVLSGQPTEAPTAAPLPTNPPPPPQPTSAPVEQPTQQTIQLPTAETQPQNTQNQQFFTEEFDSPLSDAWSILTVTGSDSADPEKVTVDAQGGKLVWDFQSEYVYYYLFYEGTSYEDVKLEVQADNRGKNNNSVSLICRYDPEVGWYEFNIANNGLYNILFAEITPSGSIGYNAIANGGSNAIKIGKDVNVYTISCSGDKLSLTINGEDVNTFTERTYGLREGGIGVSVSSYNVLPILVEMESIKISAP